MYGGGPRDQRAGSAVEHVPGSAWSRPPAAWRTAQEPGDTGPSKRGSSSHSTNSGRSGSSRLRGHAGQRRRCRRARAGARPRSRRGVAAAVLRQRAEHGLLGRGPRASVARPAARWRAAGPVVRRPAMASATSSASSWVVGARPRARRCCVRAPAVLAGRLVPQVRRARRSIDAALTAVTAAASAAGRAPAGRRPPRGPTCRPGTRCGAPPPVLPRVEQRLDDAPRLAPPRPARGKFVESPRMASSRSVSYASAGGAENARVVLEVHVDGADLHPRRRHLGAEAQRDALVGLDAQHEHVRLELLGRRVGERQVRHALELDRDLGDALRQPLARAQVERRAGPAPVVDAQARGDVGLGLGVGRDALLLAVARAPARRRCSRGRTGRARRRSAAAAAPPRAPCRARRAPPRRRTRRAAPWPRTRAPAACGSARCRAARRPPRRSGRGPRRRSTRPP